jgi:hypothetical protein
MMLVTSHQILTCSSASSYGFTRKAHPICNSASQLLVLKANTSDSFPEAWEEYLEPIPENERHDLMTAYHKRLNSDDEKTRLAAAKAWSKWEYVALSPLLEVVNSDIPVVCH